MELKPKWDEQVILNRNHHLLRQSQYGVGAKGKRDGWSLRDSAQELNISFGALSEDIRMAEAILNDPSLRQIKDKSIAKQLILGSIKRDNQQASAGEPVKDMNYNCIIHGNPEKVLQVYPSGVFDVCMTTVASALAKSNFVIQVFSEVYRVLKQNSFLYLFTSDANYNYYCDELKEIKFSVMNHPLIWVKDNLLHRILTWQYQKDYEQIILAVKGSPSLTDYTLSSILDYRKQNALIEKLLDHCCYENSLVLDPFAGNSEIIEVTKNLRRRFVGLEEDRVKFERLKERIR